VISCARSSGNRRSREVGVRRYTGGVVSRM
jgi:hypothetical protein